LTAFAAGFSPSSAFVSSAPYADLVDASSKTKPVSAAIVMACRPRQRCTKEKALINRSP
jgi:hypothetical protein